MLGWDYNQFVFGSEVLAEFLRGFKYHHLGQGSKSEFRRFEIRIWGEILISVVPKKVCPKNVFCAKKRQR